MGEDDKINWNVDLEVGLFHAIHAHRPVGTFIFIFQIYTYVSPVPFGNIALFCDAIPETQKEE